VCLVLASASKVSQTPHTCPSKALLTPWYVCTNIKADREPNAQTATELTTLQAQVSTAPWLHLLDCSPSEPLTALVGRCCSDVLCPLALRTGLYTGLCKAQSRGVRGAESRHRGHVSGAKEALRADCCGCDGSAGCCNGHRVVAGLQHCRVQQGAGDYNSKAEYAVLRQHAQL